MPNSDRARVYCRCTQTRALARARIWFVVTAALVNLWAMGARAQLQAQGFAVERFYPSAPGGGWMVMDDLSMRGRFGGVNRDFKWLRV